MSIRSLTKASPDHQYWMGEAIELAREGMALTHPNPRVGAVIIKGGRKVGEGFHIYEKRDHAEIVALRQAGAKARGATLYVNLEPCCTTGRTGPCTKAIIAAGVKRVFAAMKDPNPAVAGRGFAELKRAGIEVHAGTGEEYARELNEDFAKWIRLRLPFVTLKAALTLDGRIAARPGHATAITGKVAREAVQRLRHRADALVTGIGTVLSDDPLLTDRTGEPRRRRLLRVVLDSRLRIPLRSKLVESAKGDVLVFTTARGGVFNTARGGSGKASALERAGAEVFPLPARRGRVDLRAAVRELGKREMLGVLLEAGADVNGAALESGIVDKMILFYAPRVMGAGGVPLARISSHGLANVPKLGDISVNRYGPDFAVEGYFRDVYRDHRKRRKD